MAVALRRVVHLVLLRWLRVLLLLALLARYLSALAPVVLAQAARSLCRLALPRWVRAGLCSLHPVAAVAAEAMRLYRQVLVARVRAVASMWRAAQVQLRVVVT